MIDLRWFINSLITLGILFYFVLCAEVPAWTLFEKDIYFKVVDPAEVGIIYTHNLRSLS